MHDGGYDGALLGYDVMEWWYRRPTSVASQPLLRGARRGSCSTRSPAVYRSHSEAGSPPRLWCTSCQLSLAHRREGDGSSDLQGAVSAQDVLRAR